MLKLKIFLDNLKYNSDIVEEVISQPGPFSGKNSRVSKVVSKSKKVLPFPFDEVDFKRLEESRLSEMRKMIGAITPLELFECFIDNDTLEHLGKETLRVTLRK